MSTTSKVFRPMTRDEAAAHGLDSEPFTDAERAASGRPPFSSSTTTPRGHTPASLRAEAKARDAARTADDRLEQAEADRARASSPTHRLGRSAKRTSTRSLRAAPAAARHYGRTGARGALGLVSGKVPTSPAGVVIGFAIYAIAANYLSGGWPQVTGWLGAKFVNKPYSPTSPAAAAGASNVIPFPSTTTPGQVDHTPAKAVLT